MLSSELSSDSDKQDNYGVATAKQQLCKPELATGTSEVFTKNHGTEAVVGIVEGD